MNFGLWWLLAVPCIFGLGWVAARFDLKQVISESTSLPRSYFRGLNFLLNAQPDKAIDAFIEAVRLDPETIELHFALGNLFRRRGETERAVRVHQNLLSRDLQVNERDHALYELGQDFFKAGLLDRAEQTLMALDHGNYMSDAQRSLLEIYQIEKNWHKALEVAYRLEALGVQSYQQMISHFYCELAQQAMHNQQPDIALQQLQQALVANSANARATLLQGTLAFNAKQFADAIETWQRIEQQNPIYLSLIVRQMIEAYCALEQIAKGIELLMGYWDRYRLVDAFDIAYTSIVKLQGAQLAYLFVKTQIQQFPHLIVALRLLESLLIVESHLQEIEPVYRLLNERAQSLPRYICQYCGFRGREFYWQCPGCSRWESYVVYTVETQLKS